MLKFPVLQGILFLFLFTLTNHCFAQSLYDEMNLNGDEWQFEGIRPGQGVKEDFHKYFGEVCPVTFNWNGATVPGDVYTDLWRAGQIPDPLFGRNAMKAKWAMEMEWWYLRKFAIPPDWKNRYIRLVLKGVDYSFDAWLNGHHLGHHEGMFSTFQVPVQDYVRFSDDPRANGLMIKLDPAPRNYRLIAGRKYPWHGDYWRPLVPMGIWKDVLIKTSGPVYIDDVYIEKQIDYQQNKASLTFNVTLFSYEELNQDVFINLKIKGINFQSPTIKQSKNILITKKGKQTVKLKVEIPDVKLWWPWELGKANRYLATVEVVSAKNKERWDKVSKKFGIREITLQWNPGFSRKEVTHPWTFVINGKRLFIRSASWGGPPSIFYGRIQPNDYLDLIRLAKEANLNNLRIFGWHPTEVEEFYEICDSLGMTVWQDLLPIASVYMPENEEFYLATLKEAEACLKQIRHHPCLIMLEGGEETFYGIYGLKNNAKILHGIGEIVEANSDIPYRLTSPMDKPPAIQELGIGGKKESSHPHELHYSLAFEPVEDYVGKWDFAVIPEFAAVSAPDVVSLKRFIPEEELWPPGPSWGYHWAELDAMVANIYQILGKRSFSSLEDFVEASQITQGEVFKWGIEYIRRRKYKSSAISICHFNTYAPDMKWGIVDYYHVPKESYKLVQMAYQPLLVSLETEKRWWNPGEKVKVKIWLVNDYHESFKDCLLTLKVEDASGNIWSKTSENILDIPQDSSLFWNTLTFKNKQKEDYQPFYVHAVLSDKKGKVLSQNRLLLLTGDINTIREDCKLISGYLKRKRGNKALGDYRRFENFSLDIVEEILKRKEQ